MRYLGLDLGTKSLGIAITANNSKIITPLENFEFNRNDYIMALNKVISIIKKYQGEIKTIVLGYPTKMNNSKTEWTKTVEKFGDMIKKNIKDIKIVFQDERLTTVKARTRLKEEMNLKCSSIKKRIDKISAVIILEEYLKI